MGYLPMNFLVKIHRVYVIGKLKRASDLLMVDNTSCKASENSPLEYFSILKRGFDSLQNAKKAQWHLRF